MSEKVGQQVFVDNRPSSGGLLANELVANAAPDGYTLLLANSSFAYLPSLYTKLNFDIRKDFVPVALVATTQNLLVVHPAVPVKNVRDLIALAKKKRGGLNYASAGIGGSTHLATALFKSMTNTEIAQIPYKGQFAIDHRSDLGRSRHHDRADSRVAAARQCEEAARDSDHGRKTLADHARRPDHRRVGRARLCRGFLVRLRCAGQNPAAPILRKKLSDEIVAIAQYERVFGDQLKNNVGAEPDTMPSDKFAASFLAADDREVGQSHQGHRHHGQMKYS